MGLIKVYSAKFMKYTNMGANTISKNDTNIKDAEYINVNANGFEHEPFLIKESEISYYQNFGGGIKELAFAGYMQDDIPVNKNIDNIIGKITLPNRQLDGGAIDGEAIELFNNDKSIIYENDKDIPTYLSDGTPIKLCDNNIDESNLASNGQHLPDNDDKK